MLFRSTAKTKTPVEEFDVVFGMPNLNNLDLLLKCPEYQVNSKLTMIRATRAEEMILTGIHFENEKGDFKNDYRFMFAEVINDKLKTVKFKGVKWGVEIEPSNVSIQRLKFQASANSDQTTFIAKTDKGSLKFYFGDHSSHAGDFVFASNVSGSLSKAWPWPVGVVIGILSLPGDKKLRISDEGAMQITLDSGLALWNFTIPAYVK